MTEEHDDTALRHEFRWYVATFAPNADILARAREPLNAMSDASRAFEIARLSEKEELHAWRDALSEEVRP